MTLEETRDTLRGMVPAVIDSYNATVQENKHGAWRCDLKTLREWEALERAVAVIDALLSVRDE